MRVRQLLHTIFLLIFISPSMAMAQSVSTDPGAQVEVEQTEPSGLDYAAWEGLADRIVAALEVGRASDAVFLSLREQLVEWRSEFSLIRDANDISINTLTTQIATLGPVPVDGGSEPAILTQRRDELNVLLSQAQLPVQAAEEALGRANVLIGEIDALTRARQGDALITHGPSPLLPANWAIAARAISTTINLSISRIWANWGSDIQWAELSRDLPLTILLTIIGLALLLRGRAWVMRFRTGISQRAVGPGRRVLGFLISLGQVAAPLIGLFSLLAALNRVGVLDLRGQVIVDALPALGVAFFAALWLGGRVFGAPTITHFVIDLESTAKRTQGRLLMAFLGLVYGLSYVLKSIANYEGYSPEALSALSFPLIVAAGLFLFRLGVLLKQPSRKNDAPTDVPAKGQGFHARMLPILGQVLMGLGVLGAVAAAAGYSQLAELLIYPTILTLGVLAMLEILHLFITDMYGFLAGRKASEANEALLPVLVSFVLALLALPILALIWGARVTDLTELWATMGQGFVLGEARVTPKTLLTLVVVFSIGFALTRLIQGTLKNSILPKTRLDKGGQNAITSGLGYLGIFAAAIVAITSAGVDLSSLAIVAGALSVGIGFGLQNVVSNFVSGIILLIERPISEGDWIEVGGQMGYVRDISVRSTRIETFDRTDVILPNSDLISGVVTNYTRGNSIGRVIVPVGVAYGTDTKRVEAILRELAEAHPMVTISPPPSVVFQGFGADALDFEIRAILRDVNFVLSVKSDLNHEIARRFGEEGIEIPFAQRDVWLRNPEVLTGNLGTQHQNSPTTDAATARATLEAEDLSSNAEDGTGEGDE